MEIAVLLFLILINGLFAMSELALVSSKHSRLKARAERGDRGAKTALRLLEDPSRLLSAVQIGITLVGVVAGAYGATALADDLEPLIARLVPSQAQRADEAAFAIVIVAITYLSLVIGELVPKRIALTAPERIASLAARPMALVANVAFPAVAILRLSTNAVLRLVGIRGVRRQQVTEDEILLLVAEGATTGVIDRNEQMMIEGVLDLGARNVRSIMTPRTEVVWLDAEEERSAIVPRIVASGHSRFPVASGAIDRIVGIVQTKDLLSGLAASGEVNLEQTMRKPIFVPETLAVDKLFDSIAASEVRMAIVLDEHGVFAGLVTAADMLGAIAGARAFSPADRLEPGVRRDDGSWVIDGMTPVEDFERLMGVRGLGDPANYSTVAGLLMHALQRMPGTGDSVIVRGLKLEVVDMDGRRIDKIIAAKIEDGSDALI